MFYGIVSRILCENEYNLSKADKITVLLKIHVEFCKLFCKYKACMSDEYETSHYSIKKQHISTLEILKCYSEFFDRSLAYMQDRSINQEIINAVKKNRVNMQRRIIIGCLKVDAVNIYQSMR